MVKLSPRKDGAAARVTEDKPAQATADSYEPTCSAILAKLSYLSAMGSSPRPIAASTRLARLLEAQEETANRRLSNVIAMKERAMPPRWTPATPNAAPASTRLGHAARGRIEIAQTSAAPCASRGPNEDNRIRGSWRNPGGNKARLVGARYIHDGPAGNIAIAAFLL